MSYLPENDTPTVYNNALWVADDGSWGTSRILIVDTSKWSEKQWSVFNNVVDNGDPSIDDVIAIDNNDITTTSVGASVRKCHVLLRKNKANDWVADFYLDDKIYTSKNLTDNEQSNLNDLLIRTSYFVVGKPIDLDDILELRNEGNVNGWWLNDDEGNQTNFDAILDELIELRKKEN